MSIQWTIIAGYLYFEIILVAIMALPIFNSLRWYQLFKSRLFVKLYQNAAAYFYVVLGVLSLFLMDATREMLKYPISKDPGHLASEMKVNVKLFRAQRNFYITGFAIFLGFVIRRLFSMLIVQYELSLKAERIIQHAESTVQKAKTTIMAKEIELADTEDIEELKKQFEETRNLLDEEKLKLKDLVKELEAEVAKWRVKYEETLAHAGKGDE